MNICGLSKHKPAQTVLRNFRKKEVATFSCILMTSQFKGASAVTHMSLLLTKHITSVFSRLVLMIQLLQALTKNALMKSISISTMLSERSI